MAVVQPLSSEASSTHNTFVPTGSGDSLPDAWEGVAGGLRPIHEGAYPPVPGLTPPDIAMPWGIHTEESRDAAQAYLDQVLPGVKVSSVFTEGSTALVVSDGAYAYKIFRGQGRRAYSTVEAEFGTLSVLADEGIAPRPIAFIDAAEHFRADDEYSVRSAIGKLAMRIPSGGHLPVIVTELINAGPLSELPRSMLTEQFDKFFHALVSHRLLLQDCDIEYDRNNNRAIIIDLGGTSHLATRSFSEAFQAKYPGVSEERLEQAVIAHDLLERFSPAFSNIPSTREVIERLEKQGLSGIHELLNDSVEQSS